jgi:predicted nucleotidyltransferase
VATCGEPICSASWRKLSTLWEEIKRVAGDALLCLALYGGLVRGRYQAQQSDINILLVLKDVSQKQVDRLAPILRAAWREIRLEPFLLTPIELQRAAMVFPTKMLDIQREHRLLEGLDVLNSLIIRREDLCRRIEQSCAIFTCGFGAALVHLR